MQWNDYIHLMEVVQMVYVGEGDYDDENDMGSLRDQAWELARSSPIRILSDKDVEYVAVDQGRVLGAVFTSLIGDKFSFDIVADPKAGQVLSLRLIDAGLSAYNNIQDSGAKLELDVVNPRLPPILKKRFGFRVVKNLPGHVIMRRKNR